MQLICLFLLLLLTSAGSAAGPLPLAGGYTVVVSKETAADPSWNAVVQALVVKYQAGTVVYSGDVRGCLEPLAAAAPRYVCFVARPEGSGRAFVVAVSRLTRELDADPYTDALWGILTGYTAADALRLAQRSEPLLVRRAAAGTSIDLGRFVEGVWYSEGDAGVHWEKAPGGAPERRLGPQDSTAALVRVFNEFRPDLFLTSGHATESDWQIGYSYKNGQFRCRDGGIYGIDLQGQTFPVQSPNPKVYLPLGNCLMGHIRDRESMALAFMASAGVHQMAGYVVSTWFGYGGWGIGDLFIDQPGRFSLAEAFLANGHALVHQLRTRFPGKSPDLDLASYGIEKDPQCLERIAGGLGYAGWNDAIRDHVGLLWDRDTVAFYGDPAWEARLAPGDLAWEQSLEERDGVWTFAVTGRREATPKRPPVALFPRRLQDIEVTAGQEFEPLVADDFILLPGLRQIAPGATYKVVFRARSIAAQP
jgi:zinc protease